ncbi:helix-turn-helix domain-containing protein [Cellulomonas sp. NTE-D12]|uniref:helix-turn-helix domain-containing protein n=1 Tax=Cellulomonas sp. NTE-D12 TaxID=2962632 RepID=UPI00308160E8|nr:transcriptional regulator [Cellulomonas sp. NTE-D12]
MTRRAAGADPGRSPLPTETSRSTAAEPTSRLRDAHERFVSTGSAPARLVRRVVVDSWRRSARIGIDPDRVSAPVDLSDPELAAVRRSHPLAAGIPTARRLLLQPDAGWVAALTDHTGRLLWVEGDRSVRRSIEQIGFVEGGVWREDTAGTNAPGTALATDAEVQVVGAEHWARSVHPWSCAAAPVHAPDGRVVGVLDVTGGPAAGTPMAMSLVRATAAVLEAGLAALPAGGRLPGGAGAGLGAQPVDVHEPRLQVLGAHAGVLHLPVDAGGGRVRLSRRHTEILLLLAEHPAGLSGDELAVLLSEDELSDVTVRAEVSRLRRAVGPLLSESRPYRLTRALRTDTDTVRDALALGDTAAALAAYAGPVLPRSEAPGVDRVRADLSTDVRAAVLASRDAELLCRWVASDEGADDWAVWRALAACTPSGSAAHLRAVARLHAVEQRLG